MLSSEICLIATLRSIPLTLPNECAEVSSERAACSLCFCSLCFPNSLQRPVGVGGVGLGDLSESTPADLHAHLASSTPTPRVVLTHVVGGLNCGPLIERRCA